MVKLAQALPRESHAPRAQAIQATRCLSAVASAREEMAALTASTAAAALEGLGDQLPGQPIAQAAVYAAAHTMEGLAWTLGLPIEEESDAPRR